MTDLESSAWRPQREIELLAGTPAGGGQDRPARVLIELLKDRVGVPIRLTNIPGRGGGNAWDHLAAHPGDAHVLAINSPTIITNRLMGDGDLDFATLTPLANLYTEYLAFVVRPGSAIRSATDLLAQLARDPAAIRIAFATAIGNMNHIALARIARQAGADAGALVTDVFDSARYAVAHVVDGRAELAVISAPARLSAPFADTPTWGELSIDCVVGTWRGVIGTAAMTAQQIAFWESALRSAARGEAWRAELAKHHWVDTWRDAKGTREFLGHELDNMRSALGALGLLADKGN